MLSFCRKPGAGPGKSGERTAAGAVCELNGTARRRSSIYRREKQFFTFKKGVCDIDGDCMDHTAFSAGFIRVAACIRQKIERIERLRRNCNDAFVLRFCGGGAC